MSDIATSMRKKGYEPLAVDSFGGIGFKRSLRAGNDEGSSELENWPGEIWPGEKWFDTGKLMQDGVTPRTVVARTKDQYGEYQKKGYSPVKSSPVGSDKDE